MTGKVLNFKLIATFLLGAAYIGMEIWGVLHDKITFDQFSREVGPLFGVALGYWFRDTDTKGE